MKVLVRDGDMTTAHQTIYGKGYEKGSQETIPRRVSKSNKRPSRLFKGK